MIAAGQSLTPDGTIQVMRRCSTVPAAEPRVMSHIFNGLRDTMTTTTTLHVILVDVGPVVLSVAEYGDGQPFLLLHGGGGPDTVSNFAEQFAKAHPARVITPIHPGFGGTPRPEGLHTIRGLAALYASTFFSGAWAMIIPTIPVVVDGHTVSLDVP